MNGQVCGIVKYCHFIAPGQLLSENDYRLIVIHAEACPQMDMRGQFWFFAPDFLSPILARVRDRISKAQAFA
jgi:hypothetical protein